MTKITVQAVSLIDGEFREVVVSVAADTEQAAVDRLYSVAKDEWAYKFLGASGYLNPSHPKLPPIEIPEKYSGQAVVGGWWVVS